MKKKRADEFEPEIFVKQVHEVCWVIVLKWREQEFYYSLPLVGVQLPSITALGPNGATDLAKDLLENMGFESDEIKVVNFGKI